MAHVRKLLRDAVIAAIKSDVPAFQSRVDPVRGYMRNNDQLPAAEVSTPGEQAEGRTMQGLVSRNIELVVTIYVAGTDTVEDDCDDLAVGVEKSIFGDATVMGMIQEITPESTAFEMVGEGQERQARMQISWGVEIWTQEDDPETAV